MKKTTILAGVLIAVVLGLVVIWKVAVDGAVASAIEYYGSQALGTGVSVSSVTIKTAQGSGTIRGLRVDQPAGFGFGSVIEFDEITLDFAVDSLVSGDPYVIELVRVAAPKVTYVMNANRKSNLAALQDNLARYSESDAADPSPADEGPEPLIRIDRIDVEDGRIEADLSALAMGHAKTKLPGMHATDIGGARGITQGELAGALGQRFLQQATRAVAASAINKAIDTAVSEGSKAVQGLLDSLQQE